MTKAAIVVSALPPGVALIVASGLGRPEGAGEWLALAGRVAGAAGLACMLLSGLLIAARLPGLDRFLGGLSRLWSLHHRLGLAAFVLVLAHPPLMALAAIPWGREALGELLLPAAGDWPMWTGWLALVAMIVFLAPSFRLFGMPDYQRWKALHFVSGAALLGGIVHTVPLTRSLEAPWSLVLWGGLGGLALLAFAWRATIARVVLRRDYEIVDNQPLAPGVVELSLRALAKPIRPFRPGQFLYLTPLDRDLAAGHNEEHPYTISSAPQESLLRTGIKDLGDASAALQTARPGTRVRVEGPYGDLLQEGSGGRSQLWIGGGIGITPFVGGARSLARGMDWMPVTLIYCAQEPSRAYYLEELQAIAREVSGFNVQVHYFEDLGPLTLAFIEQCCPDPRERDWFGCGPVPLLHLMRKLGQQAGVPRSRIHTEEFNFL